MSVRKDAKLCRAYFAVGSGFRVPISLHLSLCCHLHGARSNRQLFAVQRKLQSGDGVETRHRPHFAGRQFGQRRSLLNVAHNALLASGIAPVNRRVFQRLPDSVNVRVARCATRLRKRLSKKPNRFSVFLLFFFFSDLERCVELFGSSGAPHAVELRKTTRSNGLGHLVVVLYNKNKTTKQPSSHREMRARREHDGAGRGGGVGTAPEGRGGQQSRETRKGRALHAQLALGTVLQSRPLSRTKHTTSEKRQRWLIRNIREQHSG
jgi:hypothetical protein